jgi:hypothetical protein
MAQDKNFSSEKPDPQKLQEALQNALKQASQAGAPALQIFSQLQERRAARAKAMAKALQEKLGKDHPDVIAMTDLTNRMSELNTHMAEQITRVKRWPSPRPNEWMVFGTVTDPQGKPAAGLIVRVFDRDRKYDDLLKETTTDEFGGFSLVYPEHLLKELEEKRPDLYVMVNDAKGNIVYSSSDHVLYEAGRSEYFAIGLTQKAGGKPRQPKQKISSPKK